MLHTSENDVETVWNNFLNQLSNFSEPHIEIGRNYSSGWNVNCYLDASAYCFRIYGRALNDDEVLLNYKKSTEYHSLLESQ